MIFQQFRNEGCLSYLIGDENTNDCAVIDPAKEIEPYMKAVEKSKLKLVYVIDSHSHADHITGAGKLAQKTKALLVMNENVEKQRKASEGKGDLIYASTKVAVTRWARRHAIRSDWAGAGILLNIVAPGLIQTPMTQAMIDDPKTMENFEGLLPMPIGRYGQPGEVAELIAFLISPENSLMVGQVIYIDSGSEAVR